jgi:hypothetical protein
MLVHTKLITMLYSTSPFEDLNVSLGLVNSYNFCSGICKHRSNQ